MFTPIKKILCLTAALAVFSASVPARSETPPTPASSPVVPSTETASESDTLINAGLRSLYNLDYDGARQNFNRLKARSPIALYSLTFTLWWELTNEYDEQNPLLETEFLNLAQETVKVSRESLRAGDPDGDARLCLGGALGLISRWEAVERHWFKAYRHGKQAFNAQKEAVEINPQLYDAYLGLGIFHYYTATLPSVIKFLAHFVFGGDKEQGLHEIRLAMDKGRFSRTAAQLFLIGIYNNEEKDYTTALALVREGRKEFPQSSFFHFLEILTLENAQDWTTLQNEANDFIARVKRAEPSYRQKYMHRGYFALANSHLGERHLSEALALYTKVVTESDSNDRWVTWAYLNRGKTYDLMGDRANALTDYRTVMKHRNVWGLRDQANELIDKPYRGPVQGKTGS